ADRLTIIRNRTPVPPVYPRKNFSDPKLKVLFVARNSPEKRVELFLKVAEASYKKQISVHFYMIGDFGELHNVIKPNTNILGEVFDKEELDRYYAQSHILLCTSSREGFPMVILEGMSQGVVPISTDVG